MAKSKHRKKQVVENKKHLEKVKKRYRNQNTSINRSRRKSEENDKENLDQSNCEVVAPESPSPAAAREASNEVQQASYTYEEGSGWLTGLYGWCQTGITQSMEAAKNVIFPSRALKRQLEEANERLRVMERELKSIKKNDCEEDKRRKRLNESQTPLSPLIVAAPPPPPPPPPPLPPPQAPISFRKVMTRSKTSKLAKMGKVLPPITLDDIKKVKLKPRGAPNSKVTFEGETKTGGVAMGGSFAVSMKDLQNVQLRKAPSAGMKKSSRRKSFHCSRVEASPPEFCRMKNLLKRVSPRMCRSRTDDDFGEGPTPMLTRALRRKFQAACPVSPIKSFSPSPSPSSNSLRHSPIRCSHPTSPLVISASPLN